MNETERQALRRASIYARDVQSALDAILDYARRGAAASDRPDIAGEHLEDSARYLNDRLQIIAGVCQSTLEGVPWPPAWEDAAPCVRRVIYLAHLGAPVLEEPPLPPRCGEPVEGVPCLHQAQTVCVEESCPGRDTRRARSGA